VTTFLDKPVNTREKFDQSRFNDRMAAAQAMAVHFGVPISSSLRTSIPPGGSPTSLHLQSSGGLAFDFGGPDADKERAVCEWAAKHSDLFQEVMHHDVGGGLHAHIAFEANLKDVAKRVRKLLGTSSPHGPKPPDFPGRDLKLETPPMKGQDVERWQKRMAERGWKIPVSGTYDEATRDVCVKFQKEKGLESDGTVGRATWAAAWKAPVS
jgi:hypothetical protein